LPSITLTLPTSGTVITAGLHSNNYTALQTLLNGGLDNNNFAAGKIFDPAKLMQNGAIDGDPLGWDNTLVKWVPASTLAAGRPRAPRVVVSTMAGGPPASPVDQDIWVATTVDASGTRWAFQYNAGSGSAYKWEHIGGPAIRVATGGITTASTVAVALTAGGTFTLPRSGDYWGDAGMSIGNAAGFAGSYLAAGQFAVNAVLAGYFGQTAIRQAGDAQTVQTVAALTGKTAGDVIDLRVYQNGTAATTNYTQPWFKITPIRIA
jgi:hypothetical protein